MKLEKFILKKFDDKPPPSLIHIDVPESSTFLKALILHDGIYMLYEIPSMQMTNSRVDTYVLMLPNDNVPDQGEFVDLLGAIMEGQGGAQDVALFPIYKIIK